MAFPLGMIIAWLTGLFISWIAPLYLVLPLDIIILLRTFFACVVLSILGALLAMYLVSRIEPDIAFKS
jgi:integral membrane sensor domain MASE1